MSVGLIPLFLNNRLSFTALRREKHKRKEKSEDEGKMEKERERRGGGNGLEVIREWGGR